MTFSRKSNFSFGGATRALLIAADKAVVYERRGGEIAQAYEFSSDEQGHANFVRYLSETEPTPIYALVDIVEEEYRQDVIPHVAGADRRSVLERKFARLFRGTNYCHAIQQGRESEGRKDDKVLLTAITKPDLVAPWARLLEEQKVPLAGIYSLAVLSQSLLKKIGATGTNVLLVSMQSASGLRQTFFRDQRIKISRLAQIPRIGTVPYASHIMGELEKLRRYLNSLALVSRDSPLDVYILSHGQWLNELSEHCRSTNEERFHLIDVADIAVKLGIKKPLESAYGDALYPQLLLNETPKNHYATRPERAYYTLYRVRNGLIAAGVLSLFASVVWGAFNFIEAISLKQQAADAQQKAAFYQDRYAMARRDLPPTPVEPRDIQTAVDIVKALRHYRADPFPLLAIFSAALSEAPAAQLERVEWYADVDPNSNGETGNRRQPIPDDQRIERDPRFTHYHIGVFRGRLDGFGTDYRGAIAAADALAERVGAHPDVLRAEVIQYPLDVLPESNLSGTATQAAANGGAQFGIKIILGIGDGQQQS